MCLNCGHVLHGTRAPNKCPVCDHDQGYFIRLGLYPNVATGSPAAALMTKLMTKRMKL